MAEKTDINRRDFLKIASAAGTGLAIGFYLPFKNKILAADSASGIPFSPNAWITVRPDNIVTIAVDESEMGQGVWTALPMIIAEEMELDWSKIQVIQAPVDKDRFGNQGTGGSASVRSSWEKLRKAGAVAKEMLLEAAARKWSVPKQDCYGENGLVLNRVNGKKLSYGDLSITASGLKIPDNVILKDPQDFRIIGRNIPRTDTPLKVNGTAEYAMDVDLPNMVHAFIIRCPIFGGKLQKVNDAKAKRVPGVLDIFEVENGIAVVGASTWAALQGRKTLDITWNKGPNKDLDNESIAKYFKKKSEKKGAVGRNDGNARKALKKTENIIEAVYKVPFQAHATMEPMNCVVDVQDHRCRVWAPTQFPHSAKKQAAEITGLPMDKVEIYVTFLGGGFGRRAFNDFINDGLEVSMHMGRPVKLIWMREDDMRHDYYRPASRHILKGGLSETGETIAWTHKVVAPSILFGQMFKYPVPFKDKLDVIALAGAKELAYSIPNIRVEYKSANTDVPVGWWRSVYDSQNAYANECFVDELAFGADQDPVEYRLKMLENSPRSAGVLKMASRKAGWGRRLSEDIFQGVSCHGSFGSYIAQIAEVSVQKDGSIKVHRVVCAVDCGQVVNPSIVEAQMESSIVYGLSATLNGEITIEKGGVAQSNFHEFEVLRMDKMPQVEVHIVNSKEQPGGVGEPGLPPIAPAVANAVFAATGKRIRKLPIRPSDLRS